MQIRYNIGQLVQWTTLIIAFQCLIKSFGLILCQYIQVFKFNRYYLKTKRTAIKSGNIKRTRDLSEEISNSIQFLSSMNLINGLQYFFIYNKFICKENFMFYFIFPVVSNFGVAQFPMIFQIESNPEKIGLQESLNNSKIRFSPFILTNNEVNQQKEEPTIYQNKGLKVNISINSQDNDQEYQPLFSMPKKQKKKQLHQLENRNVIPNMIRLILSFIQKKGKSSSMVQKLLRIHNPDPQNYTSQRFYLFQKAIKEKMNNYVNLQTLRQICKIRKSQFSVFNFEEQKCYNKITKILIEYFLKEQVLVFILTSKRMQKEKKKYHIQVIRQLQESIKKLLQQQ